jgi:competence protein ComEA
VPDTVPEAARGGSTPPWADRLERWRAALPLPVPAALAATAAVVVLAVVAVAFLAGRSSPAPLVLPKAGPAASSVPGPGTGPGTATSAPDATIAVHAAGAVVHPGLYVLPGGSRVADVVAAAGGPLADADLDQVNLATKVADGERVHVPRRGEVVPAGPAPGVGGASSTSRPPTLDLNAATAEQLEELPGIGPSLAKAIVDHRTRHGRFRSVDDLLEVRGIGPAKLDGLRDLVRVWQ